MNALEKEEILKIIRTKAADEAEKRMREEYASKTPAYLRKTWVQKFDENPRLYIIGSTPIVFMLVGLISDLLN